MEFVSWKEDAGVLRKWFPPAFERTMREDAGEDRYGFWVVAHWFLILLFLVPWLAFLFWRVRKQRKLTA